MMRVFLDTNILMDVAEFRRFSTEAKNIMELCRHGAFETFAATMSFVTMSYLLRCDVIITNNGEDFLEFSQLPVVSSRDFLLNYYRQQEGK